MSLIKYQSEKGIFMKKIIGVIIILLFIGVLPLFVGCKKATYSESIGKEEINSQIKTEKEEKVNIKSDEIENTENNKDRQDTEENKSSDIEKEGEYVNDFTLLDTDSNEVSLSDYQGKIVVLNFFGTWCVPCKAEIPDFVKVYNLFKDKDVQFIGISVGSDISTVKKFIDEFGVSYPILINGSLEDLTGKWRIKGIPATYFLSKNGKVISYNIGPMTEDQLIREIWRLREND